ncbi:MAG: leucyl aminopeptidase family protein [Litoreibacter sp.]
MLAFSKDTDNAIPLFVITPDEFAVWYDDAEVRDRNWTKSQSFDAKSGQVCILPTPDGAISCVFVGAVNDNGRDRFALAGIIPKLPAGTYAIASEHDPDDMAEHALGWLLSQYAFERYRKSPSHDVNLVCPPNVDAHRLAAIANGEALTRTLINTPASDMSPADLETATRKLAKDYGAEVAVITGEALLEQNFPMIHAVGRASATPPRLIDMTWGTSGPRLTLVGKGVCFDTGGLNIKPGASMGLMKKDMGGAATVLGLARMIMATKMHIRLRVLIPAVENSIDGSAFRPQDILTSRKGLTVEINNTDAEGRLVLADALALADENPSDLMICMATLTGAARVAVGPDLAPFYTDDAAFADSLRQHAKSTRDPVWEMPFHTPYEAMIEPGIADLDNAPAGGFAGSITAALFLRRFVEDTKRFAHFDIYGWQPVSKAARPKGGAGQGARAIFAALPDVLGL